MKRIAAKTTSAVDVAKKSMMAKRYFGGVLCSLIRVISAYSGTQLASVMCSFCKNVPHGKVLCSLTCDRASYKAQLRSAPGGDGACTAATRG